MRRQHPSHCRHHGNAPANKILRNGDPINQHARRGTDGTDAELATPRLAIPGWRRPAWQPPTS
eukprot:11062250-Lingulodinium_polyedra.AAC.1